MLQPVPGLSEWTAASGLLADYVAWLAENVRSPIPLAELACLHEEVRTVDTRYRDPDRFHMALVGRLPAGTLAATVDPDTGRATLERFFVRPIARGTGVASQLLDAVIGSLRADGIRRIHLETLPDDMPAAVRLYERAGFHRAPDRAGCQAMAEFVLDLRSAALAG